MANTTQQPTIAELEAQLAQARVGFDESYAYADDYSVYVRGREQWQRIADLEQRLTSARAAERPVYATVEPPARPARSFDGDVFHDPIGGAA